MKIDLVLWKAGYRFKKLEIWNRVSPWALLGNVAVGGIPGWVVDGLAEHLAGPVTENLSQHVFRGVLWHLQ